MGSCNSNSTTGRGQSSSVCGRPCHKALCKEPGSPLMSPRAPENEAGDEVAFLKLNAGFGDPRESADEVARASSLQWSAAGSWVACMPRSTREEVSQIHPELTSSAKSSPKSSSRVRVSSILDEASKRSITTDLFDSRISRTGKHSALPISSSRNSFERTPLVMISDPGQDLDDEMTFILLRCLHGIGLVDVRCVITNLHPSFKRALLCRGALDMLGMFDVPVGYGSDGGDIEASALPAGRTLLHRVFDEAKEKSLSLCLISSLKDAALFLRDNEELFVAKVKEVTIMGGVKFPVHGEKMEPDTAHNNEFDRAGAEYFYDRCQTLGIPLIIVSRATAYACPVDRQIYDDLAQSGSPIGWRLRNAQRTSIESLWKRAASTTPEARMGLPIRCDAKWFKKTFCGDDDRLDTRGANDPIWDLVKSFNMYDSIALIAAMPHVREHAFTPVMHEYMGTTHIILGASEQERGITDEQAKECSLFLHRAYQIGISLDHHQKTQVIISASVQPNIADTFLGLALLRTLIETDTVDCLGILISAGRRERYMAIEELKQQAALITDLLDAMGLQNMRVCCQHTSIRENQLELLYETAPPTGVMLLCAHATSDAAVFAMRSPELFRDKTLSVVMLGGVKKPEAEGELLTPDRSCPKISSDPNSADFLIRRCQELGVPLTVLSSNLSHICGLPRGAIDAMSRYGGDLGLRGANFIKQEVEWVYKQVSLEPTSLDRRMPASCDQTWFADKFCNGKQDPGKAIWSLVTSFRIDMPLMIMSSVPKIADHFFENTPWVFHGTRHKLLGPPEDSDGGFRSERLPELKRLLFRLIFKGILMNLSDYYIDKPVDVPGLGSFDTETCDAVPHTVHSAAKLQIPRVEDASYNNWNSNGFHGTASSKEATFLASLIPIFD